MTTQNRNNKTAIRAGVAAGITLLGAVLSRWHGGGFIGGSPKILKAFLWAALFAAVSVAAHWGQHAWYITAVIGLAVLASCMVFKNTGHGGGMDLAHNEKEPGAGRTAEKLEYLILWLHGRIDQYRYDLLLLGIIGAFSTIAPAIAIGWEYPLYGVLVFIGGAIGKPLGYAIGWKIYPPKHGKGIKDLDHATAIGEFLTGAFAFATLSAAFIKVIL